jgi:hypothetical protein
VLKAFKTMNANLNNLNEQFNLGSKSILELRFIISNSQDLVLKELAENVLKTKQSELESKNLQTSKEIDKIIRQQLWYDFHIINYDGNDLTVVGSIDLSYFHTLEIIFKNVFFVHGFLQGWHSDTSKTVFETPENPQELNLKYEIEQGHQLFIFKTEYYKNDVIIAAKSISYKAEKVNY